MSASPAPCVYVVECDRGTKISPSALVREVTAMRRLLALGALASALLAALGWALAHDDSGERE